MQLHRVPEILPQAQAIQLQMVNDITLVLTKMTLGHGGDLLMET